MALLPYPHNKAGLMPSKPRCFMVLLKTYGGIDHEKAKRSIEVCVELDNIMGKGKYDTWFKTPTQ